MKQERLAGCIPAEVDHKDHPDHGEFRLAGLVEIIKQIEAGQPDLGFPTGSLHRGSFLLDKINGD